MTEMRHSVLIDQDLCMAAGYCYGSHPELFTSGGDGVAELLSADPPAPAGAGPVALTSAEVLEKARQAAKVCPSGAIKVIQTADGYDQHR